jgi:hypothetical protein
MALTMELPSFCLPQNTDVLTKAIWTVSVYLFQGDRNVEQCSKYFSQYGRAKSIGFCQKYCNGIGYIAAVFFASS